MEQTLRALATANVDSLHRGHSNQAGNYSVRVTDGPMVARLSDLRLVDRFSFAGHTAGSSQARPSRWVSR